MRFFFSRPNEKRAFRARSAERQQSDDRENAAPIKAAIENALSRAEAEHAGLTRRLDEVMATASFLAGTESDENLTRETRDAARLSAYESEIQKANARLKQLKEVMGHFRFLHATFRSRFPEI